MLSIYSKCSINFSSRLATLAKRDEHFNEHLKRRQRRSKQIKYALSHGSVGFMRKIGIAHGNDEKLSMVLSKMLFPRKSIRYRVAKHLKRINVDS